MKEKIGSALILAALLAVVFGIVMSNAAADAERKAYYETLSAEAKAESKALLERLRTAPPNALIENEDGRVFVVVLIKKMGVSDDAVEARVKTSPTAIASSEFISLYSVRAKVKYVALDETDPRAGELALKFLNQ